MALNREAELLEVVAEKEMDAFNRTMDKLRALAVERERRWLETDIARQDALRRRNHRN